MIIDVLTMSKIPKWGVEDANDKPHIIDANIFQIHFICIAFNLYPQNALIVFLFTLKIRLLMKSLYSTLIGEEVVLHYY